MKKALFCLLFTGIFFMNAFLSIHAQEQPEKQEEKEPPAFGESIKNFLKEGKLVIHPRSMFMRRHFDAPEDKTQESMAIGGWIGYETAPWHNISVGLIGYTSQGIFFTDNDKDGAEVLAPGQKGYTVLGQAYIQAEIHKTLIRLYRQELDTPFLNPDDFRMTPITYEAYTLKSNIIDKVTLMVSQVTKIKGSTDSTFHPMSEAAGFDGTDEAVTMGGIIYKPNDTYTLQLWDYYSHEFMNVVYAQGDATWKINDKISILGSVQGMYQKSVGNAIGGDFHVGFGGAQVGLNWCGLSLSLGFTITENTHDTVNPWAGWPGYTSIMEEDNDLQGEKAYVIGISYDFGKIGLKGFSINLEHTGGWVPEDGSFTSPAMTETDLKILYKFCGKLKGLSILYRLGYVDHSLDTDNENYNDHRVIVNYAF